MCRETDNERLSQYAGTNNLISLEMKSDGKREGFNLRNGRDKRRDGGCVTKSRA